MLRLRRARVSSDSGCFGAGWGGGAAASDTRPGGGLGTPLDPEGNERSVGEVQVVDSGWAGAGDGGGRGDHVEEWACAGGGSCGCGSGCVWTGCAGGDSLLAAMKEELFALETDRLQGRLSETEYAEQKAALEVVLRRALLRGERAAETSNVAGPVV